AGRIVGPRSAGPYTAAIAGTDRAGVGATFYQPLDAKHVGGYPLLSARLLHDEVQPQAERTAGQCQRLDRSAPVSAREYAARVARIALWLARNPGRDFRAAGGFAATCRRRARRADGTIGGGGSLSRSRSASRQGAYAR